ncbi:MAG: OsmC family protein [Actinomycetes bacterium]
MDEPPALGGGDQGANPVEHLLAALGSCQVITYQLWAARLGVRVDEVVVDLRGELDLHGFFGLDAAVRPGYQSIDVEVRVRGPEARERYEELARRYRG